MQYNGLKIIIFLHWKSVWNTGIDWSWKATLIKGIKTSSSQSCEVELTSCRSLNKTEGRIDWERLDAWHEFRWTLESEGDGNAFVKQPMLSKRKPCPSVAWYQHLGNVQRWQLRSQSVSKFHISAVLTWWTRLRSRLWHLRYKPKGRVVNSREGVGICHWRPAAVWPTGRLSL
jgi:hypothetical protein